MEVGVMFRCPVGADTSVQCSRTLAAGRSVREGISPVGGYPAGHSGRGPGFEVVGVSVAKFNPLTERAMSLKVGRSCVSSKDPHRSGLMNTLREKLPGHRFTVEGVDDGFVIRRTA